MTAEEVKEKLEQQLKLQRAAHQQRKGAQAAAASSNTPNSDAKTPSHVIKIVTNSSGECCAIR